jgi:hypothetical protein
MIELLAPDETARLAKALRDSAQELWRRRPIWLARPNGHTKI